MSVSRPRALVAGGAGFIGSHLCERLLAENYEVICVDNFSTGAQANVAGFLDLPTFDLIHHDIIEPVDAWVSEIYNLACPASPVHYQFDPIQTMKTCVVGSFNLLGLAKRNKAKIIQASTSEVYGEPTCHPQREDYWGNVNPIGARSCYDEGKRSAETLFFDYRREHGLDTKVARIFNTYGPRMQPDDGRVVSNFIVQALCGDPITIYGDGKQTRSFCYVADMIEGLVRLMRAQSSVAGPINFGNPHEITVGDLADLVLSMTGSRSRLTFASLPKDDPTRRRPDITRANAMLDWEPKVPLHEGLQQTIDYFDRLLRSNSMVIHHPCSRNASNHRLL
jgi:UDP-glucuronate decarboxylase